MLATPGTLPGGPDWLFEVEWDGLRMLADVEDRRLRLADAGGTDRTGVFPELGAITDLAPDVLLDGVWRPALFQHQLEAIDPPGQREQALRAGQRQEDHGAPIERRRPPRLQRLVVQRQQHAEGLTGGAEQGHAQVAFDAESPEQCVPRERNLK